MPVSTAPTVSVLMPVRRWRPTTASAVASILRQSHVDFELLLIGHDDVASVTARLPDDSRIRALSRRSPGIVGALNTGLAEARGQYVARMDDDDIAWPDRLTAQLRYLHAHPEIDLAGTRIRFVDAEGSSTGIAAGNQRYADWLNALTTPAAIRDACFVECPLPHPTWLGHRRLFAQLGGYRDVDGPEDHDLVLRARNAGLAMGKPEAVLLDWREHPDRLTHRDARYRRQAFTTVRADAALDSASDFGLHAGRAVWICGTGRNARWWFDALHARGVHIRGFVDLDRPAARQRKRHRPVITYSQLWTQRRDDLIITAITNAAARDTLVHTFGEHDLINGRDYLLGG